VHGLTVANIVVGGPAYAAMRLSPGDIIINVDAQDVNNLDDIYQILDKRKIGDEIIIKYRREGKVLSTKVKLKAL
jgi:S1-C subfamily serine protease